MKTVPVWNEIEAALNDRSATESVWELCVRFVRGYQKGRAESELIRGIATTGMSNTGMEKIVVNTILPRYRAVVSALESEWPAASVMPGSDSSDDIIKARSSVDVLRYYWNQGKIDRVIARMTRWMVATGNGIYHTYYDKDKEQVVTEAPAPYDFILPVGYECPEEAPWSACKRYSTKGKLKLAYPKMAKEIDKAPAARKQRNIDSPDKAIDGSVAYWCVYHDDYRYQLVLDGGELLWEGMYPKGSQPIQLIKYTDIPGETYAIGMVESVIQAQVAYNRLVSRGLTVMDKLSSPSWAVTVGSLAGNQEFSNAVGKVYNVNPGASDPRIIQGSSMPPDFLPQVQYWDNKINDLSGTPSSMLGQHARGVTSGTHAKDLAEGGKSQLISTMGNVEAATATMAKTVLIYIQTYYPEGKYIRMFDGQGGMTYKELKTTNLTDMPEVFIETGSLFRSTTADRRQKVVELFNSGLMTTQEAMTELSLNTADRWALDKISALSHARECLDGLLRGEQLVLLPSDNLDAFDRVFQEFFRSDTFGMLDNNGKQKMLQNYYQIVQMKAQQPAPANIQRKPTMPLIEESAPSPAQSIAPTDGVSVPPDNPYAGGV